MPPILEPCASCGARCCNRFAVCVTGFDILRLAEGTGRPAPDFAFCHEANLVSYRHDPTFFLFDNKGKMKEFLLTLKRKKTNYCEFSKHSKGCAVYAHRPMVCRSYPFVYDRESDIKYVNAPVCWRLWREEEVDRTYFSDIMDRHAKELFEYGKIARRWNAERAKKGGTFEDYLDFIVGESRKVAPSL
jgi:Fe-S-cluster containining protein